MAAGRGIILGTNRWADKRSADGVPEATFGAPSPERRDGFPNPSVRRSTQGADDALGLGFPTTPTHGT